MTETGNDCVTIKLNPNKWNLEPQVCVAHFSNDEAFVASGPPLSGSGSCQPILGEEVAPPSWAAHVRLCENPAEGAACEGDGQCGPLGTSAFGDTCIYIQGEAECPGEPWVAARIARFRRRPRLRGLQLRRTRGQLPGHHLPHLQRLHQPVRPDRYVDIGTCSDANALDPRPVLPRDRRELPPFGRTPATPSPPSP